MIITFKALVALLVLTQSSVDERLIQLMRFIEAHSAEFTAPALALSYTQNLRVYVTADLDQEEKVLNEVMGKLHLIDRSALSQDHRLEYDIIKFETELNLERIELSRKLGPEEISDRGIVHQANGKQWYLYFIKRWTSSNSTTAEISAYGKSEAERIQRHIQQLEGIINKTEADQLLTTNTSAILSAFEDTKSKVDKALTRHFPNFESLPEIRISRGTNPELSRVPGYYASNTLYYNQFDGPYDLAQIDWLFMHEANPGHHFQISYEQMVEVPDYRKNLTYSGFREGWAAYVEELGEDLGLYQSVSHQLSKCNWDLIRSVRLILDVGINFHEWTDERALREWKKYIQDQDDIGVREIRRMRRWPAQVLTYKIGSKTILETWGKQREKSFSLKEFHTRLLSQRSIPVCLIPQLFN